MPKFQVTLEVEFEAKNAEEAEVKAQSEVLAVVEDDIEFNSLSCIDEIEDDEDDFEDDEEDDEEDDDGEGWDEDDGDGDDL